MRAMTRDGRQRGRELAPPVLARVHVHDRGRAEAAFGRAACVGALDSCRWLRFIVASLKDANLRSARESETSEGLFSVCRRA